MQIKRQSKSRELKLKSLLGGSFIAAFLVASPYFFYVYEGLPGTKVWQTSFFGINFTYNSNFYEDVNVVGWILTGKIIPLIFMFIWFFTCRHWWYHAIIIPICMYIFQIYGTLDDDVKFTDELEIYYLAPIILVALIFVYTLRMRIFDRLFDVDYDELKRVSLKGEIKKTEQSPVLSDESLDDEEDDEPLFMG